MLCLVMLSGFSSAARAEQKITFDEYEVHYATQLTSDLVPEVAKAYKIPRSGKRAFAMVHVRKIAEDGTSKSVKAAVKGKVSNLLGQARKLEWQQVEEEDSVYSLTDFPVTNRERVTFDLQVMPEDSKRSLPVQFRHQFYTE